MVRETTGEVSIVFIEKAGEGDQRAVAVPLSVGKGDCKHLLVPDVVGAGRVEGEHGVELLVPAGLQGPGQRQLLQTVLHRGEAEVRVQRQS